jgi:hypothetical protein
MAATKSNEKKMSWTKSGICGVVATGSSVGGPCQSVVIYARFGTESLG